MTGQSTPTAQSILTPEQAELLSGSFENFTRYFANFSNTHFPGLNLVMVGLKDPQRDERIRDGVMAVLDRPEILDALHRTSGIGYTEAQPLFEQYARQLNADFKQTDEDIEKYTREAGVKGQVGGVYRRNTPPHEIMAAGGQVAPIAMDRSLCASCKPAFNPLNCAGLDSTDRIDDHHSQIRQVALGFHEMAHAIQYKGASELGIRFSAMFSNKHFTNRQESIADSFMTLMLAREFGELGLDHMRLSSRGTGMPAAHTTQRAVDATMSWMRDNPDSFSAMSPAELFKVALTLGDQNALTPAEVKEVDAYQRRYAADPEKITVTAITARLDQYMSGNGADLKDYGEMGAALDQRYLQFLRETPENAQANLGRLHQAAMCTSQVDLSSLVAAGTEAETHTQEQRREMGYLAPPAASAPRQ